MVGTSSPASAAAGVLFIDRPGKLLRLRWIAEDLGVSCRWVRYACQAPEERPKKKLPGVPQLPAVPHPAGGRAVIASEYERWLDFWRRRRPEHQ